MTGDDLRSIRASLGLTQEALADLLGIHRVTLADYERGAQNIPKRVENHVGLLAAAPSEKTEGKAMKTATAPVIFGFGPEGARAGVVRFEIPEYLNPSTVRSAIRRGSMGLHGPSDSYSARIGNGYRLIEWMKKANSWSVLDRVTVITTD